MSSSYPSARPMTQFSKLNFAVLNSKVTREETWQFDLAGSLGIEERLKTS
jgi:hypothetical protein